MKDLQEIKARIIMMNANLSELMKLVFYEEGEPEPDEYPDFKVCRGGTTLKDGFVSTHKEQQPSFVTDSEKADDIHDTLRYLHLLPEGYCFCDEADAEKWIKVELYEWNGLQNKIGNITIFYHFFSPQVKKTYRPICKIQPGKHPKTNERTSRMFNSAIDSPQVRTDYTHLLPPGYEFCAEEEAEQWVKVKFKKPKPNSELPLGKIWHKNEYLGTWKAIRKIKQPASGYVTCTRKGIVPESEIPEGLKKLMQEAKNEPAPNTYQVDWSNAPEWADVHAFEENGSGYWFGTAMGGSGWYFDVEKSTFTLPSGLDWKQSKTRRAE